MKAADRKRKLSHELLQHRQQERLADALAASHHLPLGEDIDGIDVVHPFDAIEIALMDAVDTNEAHSPAGVGRAPLANGIEHGPGSGEGHPGGLVWAALAQVVQVRGRQLRQAFKACITVHVPGAAQQVHRRRPRQAAMGAIDAHQQRHIGGVVAPGKGMRWRAVALGQRLALQQARQQPRQLRARVAAGARQITQHDALVGLGQARIAQAAHHAGNVRIALLIIGEGSEADLQRAFEKCLQLGNAAQFNAQECQCYCKG